KALALGVDQLGRPMFANQIYDPSTERTLAVNGVTNIFRDPFLSNQIPVTRFDPVAVNVQKLIPAPSSPALFQNYLPSYTSQRLTTIPSLKLDEATQSHGRLSFYWSTTGTASQYSPQNNADGLPLPITAARGSFVDSKIFRLNYDFAW